MNGTLSPSAAASVARRVYDIRKSKRLGVFHTDFEDNFKITNGQIQGISGGLVNQLLNRSTGFALTAEGTSPQFTGHHIIGIRGTEFSSFADWLTNFNVGVTLGPKNLEVHAGFQKAFSSLKPFFNQYIIKNKPLCLHIVGHSLGGAIAELTAIWASELSVHVKLYTFGSPRVVLLNATSRAAHNIEHYRVTHGADPVPSVPIWPFAHTVGEYQTAMNTGAFFNINAHSMTSSPGYVNTVNSHKDFKGMGQALKRRHHINTVLNYEQRHQATFSSRWQETITDELITYLKKTLQYGAIVAQSHASMGLSYYDLLAKCLHKGIKTSIVVAEELRGLLGHILVFVGQGQQAVTEMSVKFIRWVLGLMIKALYTTAKQAIERIF